MRVRTVGIKDLVRPEQDDHRYGTHVLNRVRVARWDIRDADLTVVDRILDNFTRIQLSKSDDCITLNKTELFNFRVMVVIASSDAW